ncbi:MAG: thiol reductant ABC exporter subunit CydC [Aeromicrobium erythreum]
MSRPSRDASPDRRAERRAAVTGVLYAAGAQLAGVGLLLTSGWLIVRAAEQPPVLYLIVAIVGVRFFGIGRAALRYVERLRTHDAALRRSVRERVEALVPLQAATPRTLEGRRHGDVVREVVADVETAQDGFLRIRVPWAATLVAAAVVVLVTGALQPVAGLVVAAQAVVTMVVLRLVVPRATRRTTATLAADATELVRAAPDLLAYGAAPAHRDDVLRAVDDLARSGRRQALGEGLGSAVVLLLGAVAATLCVLLTDGLDPALVAVVALAPVALLEPLQSVADAERLRPDVQAARTRLQALRSLPPALPDPSDRRAPEGTRLVVRDLAVGWGDVPVARHLDLDLAPGDVVAVTAPSGGGKSTLAMTLVRLLEPLGGSVTLGGVALADLRGSDVRSIVGLLGQDEAILDTTLRENLRIADPGASEPAMLRALEDAGLGALGGLDLEVGEGGSHLSGGERQRLALARLLLAGHRVLVLDEPTEHLDAPAAARLLDDVLALRDGRSILLLTHSPAVLARADRVVRLDEASLAVA